MDKRSSPAQIGRPPIPIFHTEVERLAGLGLTAAQIADRIGAAWRTLFTRMEADQALREAVERGVSAAVEAAAMVLQEEALKENLTAIIFFLKTKGGFHVPREAAPAPTPIPAKTGSDLPGACRRNARRQIEWMARAYADRVPEDTNSSD